MFRNLKALALALAAVFALSAISASAAWAQQGELTAKPVEGVTLVGSQTGASGSNALTAFGLNLECPESTYVGHKSNETPHALIPNASTTATITPTYHNCKVPGLNWPATIDMNGCDYVLHLGETTGGVGGTYGVSADIVCPAEKEIVVTIWTNTTDHGNNTTPMCKLDVKAQTGLKGLHATDTGNGFLDLTGTIEGLHILKTKTTHAALCSEQTTATAKLDVDTTVEGRDVAGDRTAISISE